jgi:cation:H+ antiporter
MTRSEPEMSSRAAPAPPVNLTRQWLAILAASLAALPAPALRLLDITNAADIHIQPTIEAIIFGIGIFFAATLLTWASEVAETEVSAALALIVLALIAVLPEYAVDLFFAWTAPTNPDNAHLAIANMTGANRLLVGLAWPAIFLIYYLKQRAPEMKVDRSNSLGILFLGVATVYSFSIPLRSHLSLIDTAVMYTLFFAYLLISSRQPPEHERVFVGPAAAVAALSRGPRRAIILLIFAYAAAVIFAAAEPFAEGLVETGKELGIEEFILVQWVAPLASEAPEFILAGLLAARGRHDAGMTILISSKVNQWTLLVGSLPVAFSISGGTLSPLEFDSRQSEEVFLTAAQSMFAVAIFVSLSMSRWEALVLAALFLTQLAFLDPTIRIGYASAYCLLSLFTFARDIPHFGDFAGAVKETAKGPQSRPSPALGKAANPADHIAHLRRSPGNAPENSSKE